MRFVEIGLKAGPGRQPGAAGNPVLSAGHRKWLQQKADGQPWAVSAVWVQTIISIGDHRWTDCHVRGCGIGSFASCRTTFPVPANYRNKGCTRRFEFENIGGPQPKMSRQSRQPARQKSGSGKLDLFYNLHQLNCSRSAPLQISFRALAIRRRSATNEKKPAPKMCGGDRFDPGRGRVARRTAHSGKIYVPWESQSRIQIERICFYPPLNQFPRLSISFKKSGSLKRGREARRFHSRQIRLCDSSGLSTCLRLDGHPTRCPRVVA